jgi:type I restriction-modification system DNA methylase subunit
MTTEADTCRKHVVPELNAAGWTDDQICEQRPFTDGRIVTVGQGHYRKPGKRADYLLRYRPHFLLADFNLHTIVRLPNGVFAPCTSIPTNLLFFDRTGPTKEVWYYEQPLPEGRKTYTKTQSLRFEELADCIAWWSKRKDNDRAWRVPAERIVQNGFNLDIKNPNAKDDFEHLPPEQLAADISKKEQRIAEIMAGIQKALNAR